MIRKLLLAFAMLWFTLNGMSQEVDLSKMKIIVLKATDVNLRKAPNTNSARLMSESLTDGEGCESLSYPVWSDTRRPQGYSRTALEVRNEQVLPVIGETTGWYKAIYWDFAAGSFVVYVSKQFCTELHSASWTPNGSFTLVQGGPYDRWVIMDNSDPENGDEYVIGHLINGMMVFTASCTDKYSDLSNYLLQSNSTIKLTQQQFDYYFEKRHKQLVEFRTAVGWSGSFEVDAAKTTEWIAGEKYLAANKRKPGVKVLPSGVQYKVIKQGIGRKPQLTSNVKVHYEGRLVDGYVFDSSYQRGTPAVLPVNNTIKGWQDALVNMPVGSTWEVYIPYQLAYGEREEGKIKPYSAMIFKIELIAIE